MLDLRYSPIKALVLRFVEIMLSSAALSAVIAGLNLVETLSSPTELFVGLIVGAIIFFIFNIFMQRQYYLDVDGRMTYYLASLIPYALYIALSIWTYKVNYTAYVWLFSITKFLSYFNYIYISNRNAIIIFHIIGLLITTFAYLGLKDVADKMLFEEMRNSETAYEPDEDIDWYALTRAANAKGDKEE